MNFTVKPVLKGYFDSLKEKGWKETENTFKERTEDYLIQGTRKDSKLPLHIN